ncbi:phage tail tube protein [Nafulsella turpanensis]|uniref:phage tail tube protein n=1 Tax=Nafulsella turpanensis TaxID=1265690 RepID=UPI00037C725E|nr:phage tail tube protein [Nafulsella turpanensis]
MANEVLSKELFIVVGGKTVARATSYSFDVSQDVIDTTTIHNTGYKEGIAGDLSWNVSCDGLVTRGTVTGESSYYDLLQHMKTNKQPVEVMLESKTAADEYEKGPALITSISKSGGTGEVVTYSVSFQGVGALTTVTVPTPI